MDVDIMNQEINKSVYRDAETDGKQPNHLRKTSSQQTGNTRCGKHQEKRSFFPTSYLKGDPFYGGLHASSTEIHA